LTEEQGDDLLTLVAERRHRRAEGLYPGLGDALRRHLAWHGSARRADPSALLFDTPELTLNEHGVVARGRRIQGGQHDTVIKLRPVVPNELPPELRASPNLGVEVVAMPGMFVHSASMKRVVGRKKIREAAGGDRPIRKLFSKEQRRFFALHAPEGLGLDDLSVLGPIFVLKLKHVPVELGRKLIGEMWLYPDGTRIVDQVPPVRDRRRGGAGP
jgi:hypothetical protein